MDPFGGVSTKFKTSEAPEVEGTVVVDVVPVDVVSVVVEPLVIVIEPVQSGLTVYEPVNCRKPRELCVPVDGRMFPFPSKTTRPNKKNGTWVCAPEVAVPVVVVPVPVPVVVPVPVPVVVPVPVPFVVPVPVPVPVVPVPVPVPVVVPVPVPVPVVPVPVPVPVVDVPVPVVVPTLATLTPVPIIAYDPIRFPTLQVLDKERTSLTRTLDSNNPLEELDDPDPVVAPPVDVLVGMGAPVLTDIFCRTPRSISAPLFTTIPCRVVGVLLFPNASVNVTVIVQSVFNT
jgi:hypothetical protein